MRLVCWKPRGVFRSTSPPRRCNEDLTGAWNPALHEMPIVLTVDVHAEDRPAVSAHAACWWYEHGLPATFFVPSALFEDAGFRPHVVRLPSLGFEVGGQGHQHDYAEIRALIRGPGADLDSCAAPTRCTRRPSAARSLLSLAGLVSVGTPPLLLVALGYRVDSSATQAPVILARHRTRIPVGSRAGPDELAPDLREVPTSCLLLPAASPTFLTLRHRAALVFVRLLLWEAQRCSYACPGAVSCKRLRVRHRAASAGGDVGTGKFPAEAGRWATV